MTAGGIGVSNGFFNPQELRIRQVANIIYNKISFFMMITKLVRNMTIVKYLQEILLQNSGIATYLSSLLTIYRNSYLSLIVCYLLISTNSLAVEQIKSGVKMLDSVNVPDSIVFFDEKEKKYSLDQFEGKTILLVFWATWCASCVKEMPDLDILQKDFRKLPFEIIPVSQDYQGVKLVEEYYKNYEIRYLPIYHDFKNQLFKAFSIIGLPTAILVSPDGKMLVSFVGNTNWYDEEIRNIILANIPGNHPEPKNSYKEQSLNQSVNQKVNQKLKTSISEAEQPKENDQEKLITEEQAVTIKEQNEAVSVPNIQDNKASLVNDNKKVRSIKNPKDLPKEKNNSKIKGTDND